MATVYNFSATQGSQLSVRLNIKDASGDAINLSGSQTSGLPIGDFVYDIEKYPSGASNIEGAVDKILAGSFLVYPQVTT